MVNKRALFVDDRWRTFRILLGAERCKNERKNITTRENSAFLPLHVGYPTCKIRVNANVRAKIEFFVLLDVISYRQ